MLSNKLGGRLARGAAAQGLSGQLSVGGEQLLSFASLVFLEFYFFLFVIFLFITIFFIIVIHFNYENVLYLNPQVFSLLPFQFSSPHPAAGGVSEQLCGA